MLTDSQGLAVTTDSSEALNAINEFFEQLLSVGGSIPRRRIALRLEVWGYTNKACRRRLYISPPARTLFG